jgi:hypothetical protein
LSRRKEKAIMLKAEVIPSVLLIIMGYIDCITTVIGVLYSGAVELNPFLAGIVSTNIGAFLIVKLAATMIVAFSFVLANRALMKAHNKSTKSFVYSSRLLKISSIGLVIFLTIVVMNNIIILFG